MFPFNILKVEKCKRNSNRGLPTVINPYSLYMKGIFTINAVYTFQYSIGSKQIPKMLWLIKSLTYQ